LIYVLAGPDDYSVSQALETIKREIGDADVLSMSTTVLEGQNCSFSELKVTCETIPFMSPKRLVIVNGLIGRFESQGKSRRSKSTTGRTKKSAVQDEVTAFTDFLTAGVPDSTILVLVEGIISGENPLFKAVSKKAVVKNFPLPKDADLQEWIKKKVAEEHGTIVPKAVSLLARIVGSDMWAMANEVNKLLLYSDGRTITEEDVALIVASSQHTSVFDLVDSILEFRGEQAQKILQDQFFAGVAPVYLLFMLSRQVQLIVRASEMKKNRVNNRDIQMKLGMRSEWVLRKTLDQAERYSLQRLRDVYQKILQTDIAIKTGRFAPELALNILVAELSSKSGKRNVPAATGRR
jgi:DNA polymerase-3 subunit delta